MKKVNFASDNTSICHPQVLKDLLSSNELPENSYGEDSLTPLLDEEFGKIFGKKVSTFLVWNGTAANTLALSHLCRPFESVLASECSHLFQDECGSLERFGGNKIIPMPHQYGKISISHLQQCLKNTHYPHQSKPRVISLTQSTEWGTVYTAKEIQEICDWAHQNQMLVHIDGARLANACISLNLDLKESLLDLGVDVVSFGGTKNGLMGVEAIIFFGPSLAEDFAFTRKQGLHLASKMRYLSIQFLSYLKHDLWKKNALHANSMAQLLSQTLKTFTQIKIVAPTEANGVFVQLPTDLVKHLEQYFSFHLWQKDNTLTHPANIYRLMCSFMTTKEEIIFFAEKITQFYNFM